MYESPISRDAAYAVILQRLQSIEAKLDAVLNKPAPEVIDWEAALPLTGCKSRRAQFRWFRQHGIKPYQRGKYRRKDVTNKVAALALFGPKYDGT